MKIKKFIMLITCLAITVGFAGCGQKKDETQTNPTESVAETVSDKRISKIGATDIDDTTYNFYYNMAASYYQNDEAAATAAANQQIESIYTAGEIGKKMKLDASKKEELKSQIKSSYGSDEEYNKFLTDNGIDESFIDKYAECIAYYEAIKDHVSSNTDYSKEAEQYFKDNYLRAKHVLILTEDLDEAQKAEKKKLAEEIFVRAKSGEDFDTLIAEYSEDPGSKSEPDGYVFPEGQMVDEFYQGTKNIGIGEYNLVESSYGYHIIKRLALDETPELYRKFLENSNVEETMKSKAVDDFINEKKKEYKITVKYK